MGMGLRTIISDRISPLKKRLKLETPLIDEVPRTALIISNLAIEFPSHLGKVPMICRGKAYGENAGLWYSVSFPRALVDPSVVAIGEARKGVIPTVKAPSIAIASAAAPKPTDVTLKPAAISIASAAAPQVANITVPDVSIPILPVGAPKFSWDPGIIPALNKTMTSICDSLNVISDNIMAAQNRVNQVIFAIEDAFEKTKDSIKSVDGKVNDLRNKENTALDQLRKNTEDAVNTALGTFGKNIEDAVNTVVEDLGIKDNEALDQLRKNTETAINGGLATVLPGLYAAWGIPRTMALTSLHVRNVSSLGFEFQSYGQTTCYYIAIGSL